MATSNRPPAPANADTVEMTDGRLYWSTDGWQTAVVADHEGRVRQLAGADLDMARFLAVAQSSAGPS